MAEGGSDSDLQTDAVPGDAYEDLEQEFQAQSLQHRNQTTDPRNCAKSKTSAEEKSNTSEEVEAGFYDGIIEYCADDDDDKIGAKQFLLRIKTEVVLDGGEAPKVVLFDDMPLGEVPTPIDMVDHIITHCTYKFLYVTESFCKDKMKKRSSSTCLTESVHVPVQHCTVVPIFTTERYNAPYAIPASIRSLIGVNYFKDSAFPAEKLKKLFQEKLAYRKQQEEVIWQKGMDAFRQINTNVCREKTAEESRRQKKRNLNCMPVVQPGNVGPQKDAGLSMGSTSTQVSHTLSQDVAGQLSWSKLNTVQEPRAVRRADIQENTSTCMDISETRSDPDGDAAEHAADLPPTSTSANVEETFNTTKRPLVIASDKADEGSARNKNGTGQAYASVGCLQADDLVADHSEHVCKATPSGTSSSTAPFRNQGGKGVADGKVIVMKDTTAVKAKVDDENVDKSFFKACTRSVSDASVYSGDAGRPPCARDEHGCDVHAQYADHPASKPSCSRRDCLFLPFCEQAQQQRQRSVMITYEYNINISRVNALMVGGHNEMKTTRSLADSGRADTTGDHTKEECVEQEDATGGAHETVSFEPETTSEDGSDHAEFFTPPLSPVSSVHSEDLNSDYEDTISKMA